MHLSTAQRMGNLSLSQSILELRKSCVLSYPKKPREGVNLTPSVPIALVLFNDQTQFRLYVLLSFLDLIEEEDDAASPNELSRRVAGHDSSGDADPFLQIRSLSLGPFSTEASGEGLD